MSELEKSLKEQLESVINQNQKLLEKHFQQDSKIVKLIEDNEYYKEQLQRKENIIKEVRERLINEYSPTMLGKYGTRLRDNILEILDKDSDDNE